MATSARKKKTIGQYTVMNTLGTGGTCKVKLAYSDNYGKVAIKFLKDDLSDWTRQTVCKEVQIMQTLKHKYILEQLEANHDYYQKFADD